MSLKSFGLEHISRPLLTTKEVVAWSGCSYRKILDLSRSGLIGIKIGNRWLYSPDQLERFFGVNGGEDDE